MRSLKILLAAMLIMSPFVSDSSKAGQSEPPFSIGKQVFTTPDMIKITNDYVVLKNPREIRLLDVATGEDVDPSKYTEDGETTFWSTIDVDDNYFRNIHVSIDNKTGESIAYDGNCFVVSKECGIACKLERIDYNNRLITVWDINAQKVMWSFKTTIDVDCLSGFNTALFDDYLIFLIGNSTTFFDLWTGTVKLVTKPLYIWRTQRYGKYLIVDNVLFDMEKLEIVYDGHNASLWFDNGLVYIFPPAVNEKLDYSILDPATMKFTPHSVNMPISKGMASYIWNGVKNGVMARWNAEKDSIELLDCKTGEVLFGHKNTYTHAVERAVVYNDRYAIVKDSAEIFCYDFKERKLAWSREIATYTQTARDGFYWQPMADNSKLRVFKMLDPKRSVVIDSDRYVSFFPSDDCVFSFNDSDADTLLKFDWDGKKTVLPPLDGLRKMLRLPFVWKNSIYVWVKDESGMLLKLEKGAWNEVFKSETDVGFSAAFKDGLLAFVQDKDHAGILNIDSMKSETILYEKLHEIQFRAGFLLLSSWINWSIFNPKTMELVDDGIKKIIGSDSDTLYYTKGDYVCTLAPKEKKQFKNIFVSSNLTASNGLFLFDSTLIDQNGNLIQLLSIDHYKLTTINGKTYVYEDSREVNFFELEINDSYSIDRDAKGLVFKNNGSGKISFKCWLVPYEGFVAKNLGKPNTLEIDAGKSESLNLASSSDRLLIVQSKAFFDQMTSDPQLKRIYETMRFIGTKDIKSGTIVNVFRLKARK